MMNPRFFALLMIFLVFWKSALFAQNADSVFVFTLLTSSEEAYANSEYESAHLLCDKAITYAKDKRYDYGLAFSYIKKSEIYLDQDELDQADYFAQQAGSIGRNLENPEILAISDLLTAQILMYSGQISESFPYFEKSISDYFAQHHSPYAALAYNDYGYALGRNGNTEKQLENLMEALAILEEVSPDNAAELAITLNNISIVHYGLRQMDKAITYAKRSIAYREKAGEISKLALGYCNLSQFYRGIDPESVEKYLKLCEKYAEQSGDEARMSQAYITTALLYGDKGERENALDYELKAITLLEKSQDDPNMLARRYLSVAMHAMALEQDSTCVMEYFGKSLALAAIDPDKVNYRDLYRQLSEFYKKENDHQKALSYYTLHIQYRDSLISENTVANIAELETKYETEKKDNQIRQLQSSRQINELQIEKQNAVLASNRLEASQKLREIELLTQTQALNELEISQQKEQLLNQKLLAQNRDQQLQIAAQEALIQDRQLKNSKIFRNLSWLGFGILALLAYFLFNRYQLKRKIEEQESLLAVRGNIAKDLHDEIGSTLTSIKILSEVSAKRLDRDSKEVSPFLQKITQQSAEAQQGMSDIIWAINPENDKLKNMVVRMREYVAQTLESRDIHTQITIPEDLLDSTIPMEQRRDFLLAFKEIINNVAKHAEAKSVTISLEKKDGKLLLQVKDDGKGFDPEAKRSSSGLKNLAARANALKGNLSIQSEPGQGSSVTLTLFST